MTDGKAVGTYLEHKFQELLAGKYKYTRGSSARGIDFPKLGVDIQGDKQAAATIVVPFQVRALKGIRSWLFSARLRL